MKKLKNTSMIDQLNILVRELLREIMVKEISRFMEDFLVYTGKLQSFPMNQRTLEDPLHYQVMKRRK
jgi:hypothetical protein